MTKGMRRIGGLPAALDAERQEPAIARIHQRMDASESIAELPVTAVAMNFMIAIARLPPMSA